MDSSFDNGKYIVGGLALAGAAAGTSVAAGAFILFSKAIPRPDGPDESMADEFADPVKMAEYMDRSEPVKKWTEEIGKEDVWITARDGCRLHAFFIAAEADSDKLAIIHHGYTSRALALDTIYHAKYFHDKGFDVLVPDLRAHGQSDGDYAGFGVLDRFDTARWVQYARDRFGDNKKIVLHGTSMGAATVLMSLGEAIVQKNVSAVIADCGFTSPADIFTHVIKKNYHIPVTAPIIKISGAYCKKKAGYAFDEYSTVDALSYNKVPVLFIHGKEDKFVPTNMSRENYKVCTSKKKLLVVESAGHASSVFENTALYEKTEGEFLAEIGLQ